MMMVHLGAWVVSASSLLLACAGVHETGASRSRDDYIADWAQERPGRCRDSAETCRWLRHQGPIDVGCDADPDDNRPPGHGPAILFRFGSTSETLEVTPENAEEAATLRFNARAALCVTAGVAAEEAPTSSDHLHGLALLQISNSPKYLFHEWPTFVQKVLYAHRVGVKAYVWLGELSHGLATSFDTPHCPRPDFHEVWHKEGLKNETLVAAAGNPKAHPPDSTKRQSQRRLGRHSVYLGDATALNSNHHCKIIATFALLDDPTVDAVVYVDTDIVASRATVVNADASPLEAYHLKTAHDIELTPSDQAFWRNTGSRFYVRDVVAARRFLSNWMTFRCGFKDQISLWHVTLLLAKEAGCRFAQGYEDLIIANFSYSTFRHYRTAEQIKETKRRIHIGLEVEAKRKPALNPLGFQPALEANCATLQRECPKPEALVCSSATEHPLPELLHYTVDVKHPLRPFTYLSQTKQNTGAKAIIHVMDVRDYLAMWNLTDDPPAAYKYVTDVPAVSNAKFLHDLALDLFQDTQRLP